MPAPYFYQIHIEEHITDLWSDWFYGMKISKGSTGHTVLSGFLCDQTALYGVLNQIHNLNLTLLAVSRSNQEDELSH
ncbi:MAG: hypothetical protein CVU40_15790 [Chloroflexi bacterium HGW-Chloroflexi-2]|jgi:hypothetical protein|nr:MAG: hypothetical protein CVU40_15790 [Chloroflexi bacterium HGW-Chloroflexi-2]